VETYDPISTVVGTLSFGAAEVSVFPNPASDLIAIQVKGLLRKDMPISLFDLKGQEVRRSLIPQGSTIWYVDVRTLYDGTCIVRLRDTMVATLVTVEVVRWRSRSFFWNPQLLVDTFATHLAGDR